jgi:hypothetical protein
VRLWTLHPRYFDAQGLVALWREGLLAQKVLAGQTRGYRHHPQLTRFRETANPLAAIGAYLAGVHAEAAARGYCFEAALVLSSRYEGTLHETKGQLLHEWGHLKAKLRKRSRAWHRVICSEKEPRAHPLFRITRGGVRHWERV